MASTYNYQTGQVTFDFKLKKCDGVCRRPDMPPIRIGNDFCRRCRSNAGSRSGFVMCKHHTWDDEGAQEIYNQLAKDLKHEALCAMCY